MEITGSVSMPNLNQQLNEPIHNKTMTSTYVAATPVKSASPPPPAGDKKYKSNGHLSTIVIPNETDQTAKTNLTNSNPSNVLHISPPIQPRTANINYLQDDHTNYPAALEKKIDTKPTPLTTASPQPDTAQGYEDTPVENIFAKMKPKQATPVPVPAPDIEENDDNISVSEFSIKDIQIAEKDAQEIRNALNYGAAEKVLEVEPKGNITKFDVNEDGYDEFGEARPFRKKDNNKNVRIDAADDIHKSAIKPKIVGTPRPTVSQLLNSEEEEDEDDDNNENSAQQPVPPKSILKQSSYDHDMDDMKSERSVHIEAVATERDPNKPKLPNTPRPTASQLVFSDDDDDDDEDDDDDDDEKEAYDSNLQVPTHKPPPVPQPKSILKPSKYNIEELTTEEMSVRFDAETKDNISTKPRAPATPRPTIDLIKYPDNEEDEADDDDDADDNWDLVQQHRTSINHTMARQSQTHIDDDVLKNMPKIPSRRSVMANGGTHDSDKLNELFMNKPKTLREMQSQQNEKSHSIRRHSANVDSDTEA